MVKLPGTSWRDCGEALDGSCSDQVTVIYIADIICREMEVPPAYRFTGGVDGGRSTIEF